MEPPSGAPGFTTASATLVDDLCTANAILGDQQLVDGFGHVSVRHDGDPTKYVITRDLPAGMVTPRDLVDFTLDSAPVRDIGVRYISERYIHGEIYKARPDVHAVIHTHAVPLIMFSIIDVPLRPVYHMGAFLGEGVPNFEIRDAAGMTDLLVKTPQLGQALARSLGDKSIALMRGHGATIVGRSLRHAVFQAIYAKQNAELQADAMRFGPVKFLEPEESVKCSEFQSAGVERPWQFWKLKALGRG